MSKRITGYVNWHRNRRGLNEPAILSGLVDHIRQAEPDHIAVTGDLVNLGLDAEFESIKRWLRKLGEPHEVTVVCGNHDAYVPGALKRALNSWQSYAIGDDGGPVTGASDYPILRRRGKMSIIGCNSARASLPFMAVGNFKTSQGRRLGEILKAEGEEGRFRVVAIHHPPFSRATSYEKRLVGASAFRHAVREHGAELVIHGHTHVDSFKHIEGPDGKVPVIGVPSAAQAPGGKRPAGRYNIFEIEHARDRGYDIHWTEFGYGSSSGDIVKLAERQI